MKFHLTFESWKSVSGGTAASFVYLCIKFVMEKLLRGVAWLYFNRRLRYKRRSKAPVARYLLIPEHSCELETQAPEKLVKFGHLRSLLNVTSRYQQ